MYRSLKIMYTKYDVMISFGWLDSMMQHTQPNYRHIQPLPVTYAREQTFKSFNFQILFYINA